MAVLQLQSSKVEVLIAKIAQETECEASSVSLMIDGEEMEGSQSFQVRMSALLKPT